MPEKQVPAESKPAKSLSAFVYRTLTLRVVATGLLIALAFGLLIYATQSRNIGQNVVEDAQNRLDLLVYLTRQMAQDQGIEPSQAFQQLLAGGRLPIRPRQHYGDFVYALFYTSAGEKKGVFKAADDPRADLAQRFVSTTESRFPAPEAPFHQVVRLKGRPYIHLAVAVEGPEHAVLGHAEAMFALSDRTAAQVRKNTLRSIGYMLLVVLFTTAMLYPVILTLTRRLARYSETLLDSNLETLSVLGSTIAKRDSDTDAHNYRVTIYAVRMAEALGMEKASMQRLIKGAFLHDVGKIGIRDDILLKPGRLDEKEYAVMKTHVNHGGDIVQRSAWLQEAADVVNAHHEKFDGNGYPQGLKAEQIPLAARIFAIVDVFDALNSKRPYKKPLSLQETMQILEQGKGTHFDPRLLDLFATLAPALYREFSDQEGAPLKSALEAITHKYFSAGIETLTY